MSDQNSSESEFCSDRRTVSHHLGRLGVHVGYISADADPCYFLLKLTDATAKDNVMRRDISQDWKALESAG